MGHFCSGREAAARPVSPKSPRAITVAGSLPVLAAAWEDARVGEIRSEPLTKRQFRRRQLAALAVIAVWIAGVAVAAFVVESWPLRIALWLGLAFITPSFESVSYGAHLRRVGEGGPR